MALTASKISHCQTANDKANLADSSRFIYSFSKSGKYIGLDPKVQRAEIRKQTLGSLLSLKVKFSWEGCTSIWGNPCNYVLFKKRALLCQSTSSETQKCAWPSKDHKAVSRGQPEESEVGEIYDSVLADDPVKPESTCTISSQGLANACKFVYNDAKYVNERARNDMILLTRGITRLNDRARQDVAILGLGFLRLDARARQDTEKIDHGVKKRAECLHHIAMLLKEKAGSRLKKVADLHWSDGALEADLRRADLLVKRRAMEDAYMALEFVKNVHDMMVSKMYQLPRKRGFSALNVMDQITLEKNGKALDVFLGDVSNDRISALQEVYWDMASALSEADGIDYTDPEELELLVATLIDLDAMDGKSSVSLLAECSSSPDVSTRQALANALASAPSMWTLGNAGMGALQRLAGDSNPAVAAAASKAIMELKRQWEIEDGDSWRFTMNSQTSMEDMEASGEETEEDIPPAD
ncbi:senescence-associated protein AAF, chloroplastic [Aristolochia californica]|uniref:senescence-associated protein AAF, chloroplastic n=1 Tax=Aristolochia californica TaxID=171875 RepID=UPI0035D56242